MSDDDGFLERLDQRNRERLETDADRGVGVEFENGLPVNYDELDDDRQEWFRARRMEAVATGVMVLVASIAGVIYVVVR